MSKDPTIAAAQMSMGAAQELLERMKQTSQHRPPSSDPLASLYPSAMSAGGQHGVGAVGQQGFPGGGVGQVPGGGAGPESQKVSCTEGELVRFDVNLV